MTFTQISFFSLHLNVANVFNASKVKWRSTFSDILAPSQRPQPFRWNYELTAVTGVSAFCRPSYLLSFVLLFKRKAYSLSARELEKWSTHECEGHRRVYHSLADNGQAQREATFRGGIKHPLSNRFITFGNVNFDIFSITSVEMLQTCRYCQVSASVEDGLSCFNIIHG